MASSAFLKLSSDHPSTRVTNSSHDSIYLQPRIAISLPRVTLDRFHTHISCQYLATPRSTSYRHASTASKPCSSNVRGSLSCQLFSTHQLHKSSAPFLSSRSYLSEPLACFGISSLKSALIFSVGTDASTLSTRVPLASTSSHWRYPPGSGRSLFISKARMEENRRAGGATHSASAAGSQRAAPRCRP